MTVLDAATPTDAEGVEPPSGKWRGDENFPVGWWLIRRDLRVHVHAFYRFARNADDIADSPTLPAADKLRRLDRMAAVLDGASGESGSPAAAAMRASLAATGVTGQHCHDVLQAFRLDATKLRYRDWDDLMEYCRYSAAPVGRQLLDLHGESRATRAARRGPRAAPPRRGAGAAFPGGVAARPPPGRGCPRIASGPSPTMRRCAREFAKRPRGRDPVFIGRWGSCRKTAATGCTRS